VESDEVIVLDTQALVWWIGGSPRLSRRALSAITRHEDVVIPAICTWELALLVVRETVGFKRPVAEVLAEVLAAPGVRLEPLSPAIGIRAAQLSPDTPMDPADQLVAATALVLRAALVTSDEHLRSFPGLKTIW
jgi:PIN domain nuclease of toxin-antitoxin system